MKTKFKKGDKVRIRSWEDMEKEFGLDDDGDIDCHYSFTKEMKNLCGLTATVDYIEDDGAIFLAIWEDNHQHFYFFEDCMLEPVIDKVDPDLITIVRKNDKIVATYMTTEVSISEQDFVKGSKLAFEELIKHFEEIDDSKVYTRKENDEKFNTKEEPKKEEFKPYLKDSYSVLHCGNIGEETNQTDVFEEKLCVGDVVELYNVDSKKSWGEHIIIYTYGKYGVMRVHVNNFKNGISDDWRIRKVKSYEDLIHNEKIDDMIAILKEE